jgi:hypothetical protein
MREGRLVGQIHSIKRRVLGSGKVSFDAERSNRGGHADRFWAVVLACQKERALRRAPGGDRRSHHRVGAHHRRVGLRPSSGQEPAHLRRNVLLEK